MRLSFTCFLFACSAMTSVLAEPLPDDQAISLESDSGTDLIEFTAEGDARYLATTVVEKGSYRFQLTASTDSCDDILGPEETSRARFNQALPLTACPDGQYKVRVLREAQLSFELDWSDPETPTVSLSLAPVKKAKKTPYQRPLPNISCESWQGEAVSVTVDDVFNEGDRVRDYYSGATATVRQGTVTLTPAAGSNGMLLLERAEHQAGDFQWDNATVYFVMPDRFHNGRTDNDHSFQRQSDNADNVGTFHGGDLAGLIEKLDYIEALGANALWMTPIVEQVKGFVAGGENSEFPFYGYHGYWTRDFTRLDPNFGTEEELRTLVREAHERGIRIVWDAVINHVGYATLADLMTDNTDVLNNNADLPEHGNLWRPGPGQDWSGYHQLIDYQSPNWATQWWGPEWVRSGLPGYTEPGGGDLNKNLAGLPDFRTDQSAAVELPPILKTDPNTQAKAIERPVIDHVIDWQTRWVRDFGIDAFRADTVKHVELEHWQTLKDNASAALDQWRQANPDQVLDDTPFWMVGEVYNHPLYQDFHYDYGFDSLVNFSFQDKAPDLAQCLTDADEIFDRYAKEINSDADFNALSYISSHDTDLFYAGYQSLLLQKRVAAAFLLLPGGVQIYYGDETGRPLGPYASDYHQGTRSDMNWEEIKGDRAQLLDHWRKLGQFRNRHPAIGAGQHKKLSQAPYAFSRTAGDDKVIIVFAGNEK